MTASHGNPVYVTNKYMDRQTDRQTDKQIAMPNAHLYGNG